MYIHVVRPGDTVTSVAERYGVSPARLASDNEVPPDGALAVGQTLAVCFPETVHAVRAGDTLTGIAALYGVSVRRLWQHNWFLQGGAALTPGQDLVIACRGEKLGQTESNGYAYPFTDRALLAAEAPYQTFLTPFTYGVTAEGRLLDLPDAAVRAAARDHGAKPVLHLSTYTEEERFDTARAVRLLGDPAVRRALIADVRAMLAEKGFAGVDVDFEFLPGSSAQPYAAFLAELRGALAPEGYFVWAALAPKTSAGQKGLLYEGHDYAAVGAAADAVLLMTYEWGYTYGPPMAVAPLPNVRAVLDYAVTEIPPEKIFLGVPNYGYDWPLPYRQGVTRAQSLSNQEAIALAVRVGAEIAYDEAAAAPHFGYTDPGGIAHEVWFEDGRSMQAKLALIAGYGLRGAGFWNLTRPFSQTWLVLAGLYDIKG
jgi:spore germination protein